MVYVITIFQKNFAIFVVFAKEDDVCLLLVLLLLPFVLPVKLHLLFMCVMFYCRLVGF